MDEALRLLKMDMSALVAAYRDCGGAPNEHNSNHNPCPLCGDETGFSFVQRDGQNAIWKCHAKCGASGGTIIDLLMRSRGLTSKDACKLALEKYGRHGTAGQASSGTGARTHGQPVHTAAPAARGTNASGGATQHGQPHTAAAARGTPTTPTPTAAALKPQKQGRLYLTVENAAEGAVAGMSRDPKNADVKFSKYWRYCNERGEPVIVAMRFDMLRKGQQSKEFMPAHRDGNGWRLGLAGWADKLMPIYNLPAVLRGPQEGPNWQQPHERECIEALHIAEGEKCADALGELELTATTSQGGSKAPLRSDWSPALRFERVIIWPDLDEADKQGKRAGDVYAAAVAGQIRKLAAAAKREMQISIVDLRGYGLSDGQDIYDLLAAWKTDGTAPEAMRASLAEIFQRFGRPLTEPVRMVSPQDFQPAPVGPDPVGLEGRQRLQNYEVVTRTVTDGEGKEVKKTNIRAMTIDAVIRRVQHVVGNWPCRVFSPGARSPLLFVDYGEAAMQPEPKLCQPLPDGAVGRDADGEPVSSKFGALLPGSLVPKRIRWIGSSEGLKLWLHQRSRLCFREKLDDEGANYCGFGDVYQFFGGARGVGEFYAVETRPHWPIIQGHYYAWSPTSYQPNGEKLKKLISFFANTKDKVSQVILAAAALTPGSGIAYGKRPVMVVTAADRGYGKSTVAECIAKLWGGHLSINLEGRDEDELIQRLLTPDATSKRVGIIGNVKGTLSSGMFEELVTSEVISGKRLYSGEASRPNTMTYFITANGVRLSRDIARRSYFIELVKPAYNPQWDRDLAEYVAEHGRDIVADVGWWLSQPMRFGCKSPDTWGLWIDAVLDRACQIIGGITPDEVVAHTTKLRNECDDDQEEMELFLSGLCEKVAALRGFTTTGWEAAVGREVTYVCAGALERLNRPVFITSTEMQQIFNAIMNKKLGTKQVRHILRGNMESGRLKALTWRERHGSNGYEIDHEVLKGWLKDLGERLNAENNRQSTPQREPALIPGAEVWR